jgi:ubiquinone/menaquinone biosynthesis C-methylase UbiE
VNTDLDVANVKACCAAGYSSDLVPLLLGPSYHPGGTALTRRLLDLIGLARGHRLADVASGVGTTALLAAMEYGAIVDGVDLSAANARLATEAAAATGFAERATFHHADAEALPLPDAGWDAVVCECALCTFPDKPAALTEMTRVLKPGGKVGITDITADRTQLPDELTGLTGWIACVADARPATEYAGLVESAGLRVLTMEPHTAALTRMIDQIGARLDLLKIIARPRLADMGLDINRAQPVLDAARTAVTAGTLGYILMVAEKPCP